MRTEFERYSTYRPWLHRDYACKDDTFHDYSHIKGEDEHQIVECCVRCGHEITFNKSESGRIDNVRYGETHMLHFMQPTHPFYEKYYARRKKTPSKADIKKKCVEEAKEEFRKAAFDDF